MPFLTGYEIHVPDSNNVYLRRIGIGHYYGSLGTLAAASPGAKNLKGSAVCRAQAVALAGMARTAAGAAICTSSAGAAASNGRAELDSMAAYARSSLVRGQLTLANGPAVFSSPPAVTVSPNLGQGTTGSYNQGRYPLENAGTIYQLTTVSGNTALNLITLLTDSSFSSAAVFTSGSAIESVTVSTTHLTRGAMDIDGAGGLHVINNAGADIFYYRQSTGLRYCLTPHISAFPMSAGYAAYTRMYVESASVVHFFYPTTWTASGKTYMSIAVATFDGATWSAATRFGGATWISGGYSVAEPVVYQAVVGAPKSVYLSLPATNSAGTPMHIVVWVDLAAKTASSTPILTVADAYYLYHAFIREAPPQVVRITADGLVSFRIGPPAATTNFTAEKYCDFTYTTANWKTPTVGAVNTLTGLTAFNNTSSAGRFRVGGVEYEVGYRLTLVSGNLWRLDAEYRATGTSNTFTTVASILPSIDVGSTSFPFTAVNQHYLDNEYDNLVSVVGNSGMQYVVRVRWGAASNSAYATDFAGALTATATVVSSLNVASVAQSVNLAGTMPATATSNLDLYIGTRHDLAGTLGALSTISATLNLGANNYLAGTAYAVSSASMQLKAGGISVSGSALCSSSAQLLDLHYAVQQLQGSAPCRASTYVALSRTALVQLAASIQSMTTSLLALQMTKPLAGTAPEQVTATGGLSVVRTIAGAAAAKASVSATLHGDHQLAGTAACRTSVTCWAWSIAPVVEGIAVAPEEDSVYTSVDQEEIWTSISADNRP